MKAGFGLRFVAVAFFAGAAAFFGAAADLAEVAFFVVAVVAFFVVVAFFAFAIDASFRPISRVRYFAEWDQCMRFFRFVQKKMRIFRGETEL